MKCIICGREIKKSYAAAGYLGNYCKTCAIEQGYTPDQISALVKRALGVEYAEQDYNKELETLKKSLEELRENICDGIVKILNGATPEKDEKSPPKIDKCEGCIYRGEYQDMGATTPICKNEHHLVNAVVKREDPNPCKDKVTWQEMREYAKRREADNGTNKR